MELKEVPEQVHVFYAQKEIIVYNIKIEEIQKDIEKQLALNPNDIKLNMIYAQILYLYSCDYKKALQYLQFVLSIDPLCLDARLLVVEIIFYFTLGRNDECQKLLEECIQLDPDYWRIYYVQLKYYNNCNEYGNKFITQQSRQILNKFPKNYWLTLQYLQALTMQDHNKKEVAELLQEIEENKQYLDFDAFRRYAYIMFNLNEEEKSVESEKKGIYLNPNSFQSLNNIGHSVRYFQKNYVKCVEYCERALQLNPKYHTAQLNIAYAYQKLGEYKLGSQYFKSYFEQRKKLPQSYINLINNFDAQKDKQSSLYYTQKALTQFPKDETINFVCTFKLGTQENVDLEQQEINLINSVNSISNDNYKYTIMTFDYSHFFDRFQFYIE